MTEIKPDWIAVDWGTTNLRVWAMSASGTVLGQGSSDQGMGQLSPADFEPALLALVSGWLGNGRIPVIACGMIGARQGWVEAPYTSVPCPATSTGFTPVATDHPDLDVYVIPGIKQMQPADVMRGEETQIAGFLALNPGWDGVLCLPGTHSKWVHISANEIVSFQTFMTGELFAILTGHSVLQHSVGDDGWDDDQFSQAVQDTLARPERIAAGLFTLRAETLLLDLSPQAARARLSGQLIGAELAAARPYWLGQNVAVIGAGHIAQHYVNALALQAVPATLSKGEKVTLAGLTAAYRSLKG